MKKLYLVRHGHTQMNASHQVQGGGSDSPLTPTGQKQAAACAQKMSRKGIQAWYSSDQPRALETISYFTREPVHTEEGLREMHFGSAEGVEQSALPAGYDLLTMSAANGGESQEQVGRRMKESLSRIMEENEGPVLALSHGAAIYMFLKYCFDLKPWEYNWSNCSISEVDYEDGEFIFVGCQDGFDG